MKKALLFLGLALSITLVQAESTVTQEDQETATIETPKYHSGKKFQNVITIDTGTPLVSCTLTPLSRPKAKDLFGSTGELTASPKDKIQTVYNTYGTEKTTFWGIKLSGQQTVAETKIANSFSNLHCHYLPVKVVIKNNSTRNLVIPNTMETAQPYLQFKNYELESVTEILKRYNLKIGTLGHIGYSLGCALPGIIGLALFSGIFCPGTAEERINYGILGLALSAIAGLIAWRYHKAIIQTNAHNGLKEKLNDLNEDADIEANNEYITILPGRPYCEILFIDAEKHPNVVKELTNPNVSSTIAHLNYVLE
jgi:hypothetical protein